MLKNVDVLNRQISQEKMRNVNIDLLRIVGMFFIVLGHCRPFTNEVWTNSFFELGVATTDFDMFVLTIMGYLGAYGNAIFIICAAFFLSENNCIKKSKILCMITDNWVISVIALIIAVLCGVNPSAKIIIKSILPVNYGVNWFIGCYIFLYLIHPYLNVVIHYITRQQLLMLDFALFWLYFVHYFILPSSVLYFNYLVGFICVYFIVAYFRLYMQDFWNNKKLVRHVLYLCSTCMVILLVTLNFLGLHINMLNNKIGYFSYFNNGLIFISCYSIFSLIRNVSFKISGGGQKGNL